MTLVARHAAHSDIGLHRKSNEDAYVVAPPLFAVCDGMGGALGGEVASGLAAQTLTAAVAAGRPLLEAAGEANAAVYQRAHDDHALTGMGTTLTAVVLEDETGHFVHIGDSRAYLLRDGELEQLSDDHSLVGEMMRDGRLTAEEAAVHPHRSILSRALGTEPLARIDEFAVDLRPGDALLLCSDGLSGPADEKDIRRALGDDDPEAAAAALIAAARKGGAPDNVTAVVLRFDEVVTGVSGEGAGASAAAPVAAAASGEGEDAAATGDPAAIVAAAEAAGVATGAEANGASRDADDGAADGEAVDEAAPPADEPDAGDGAADPGTAPASPADDDAAAGAAAAASSRRRLGCLVIVLLLLVALGLGAALVLSAVYYVGVDDGNIAVYSGLPLSVGPVPLHAVYRRSVKPYAALDAVGRQLVDAQTLRSRDSALALAEALGMWP